MSNPFILQGRVETNRYMSEYYFIDAYGRQRGPIDESELLQAGITPQSSVWRPGMAAWTNACDVAELNYLFVQRMPPMPPVPPVPPVPPRPAYQAPAATPPSSEKAPSSYLPWAIASTVLCCVPLGIVAIYFASKVDSLWRDGDRAGALSNAEKAKMWTIISAVAGIVAGIIAFFISFLSAL